MIYNSTLMVLSSSNVTCVPSARNCLDLRLHCLLQVAPQE
jgi:hypothetical protein